MARLRTARGQLRAAERLLVEDRPLEAGLQIRPVRAAIWKLAADAVRELLSYRKPYYQRAADLQIDTSKLAVAEVVEEILKKLKEYASNYP